MCCIAAAKRCPNREEWTSQVEVVFWSWSKKIQLDQYALRILSAHRIRLQCGGEFGIANACSRRTTWKCRRDLRQEKVDENRISVMFHG